MELLNNLPRIFTRVPRGNCAFLGQCTLFPILSKKIEKEMQFSRRAFFSIFNTQRREIAWNASSALPRIAYRGLHAGKGKNGREGMFRLSRKDYR